jgi:hypothetical protein
VIAIALAAKLDTGETEGTGITECLAFFDGHGGICGGGSGKRS